MTDEVQGKAVPSVRTKKETSVNLSRDDQFNVSPASARVDLCGVRDEDLIVQVQNGQPKAYDELVARYKGRLFSFILRMVKDPDLAEELT